MNRSLFLCLLGAMTMLYAAPSRAGGFSNPDFGIRRIGMFAVVARPDDVTAIFHNPAGLTLNDGTLLYHAQSWFFVDLAFRFYDSTGQLTPDYEIGPDWNVGFIPFIGMASDLGTEDLRIGFGVYAPNAYGAAMPEDEPTRYHAVDVLFLASRATASVAYRVGDKLSVGASFNLIYVYLTASRYLNHLVVADPDQRFADPETLKPFDMKLEMEGQDWTWAADFGVLLRPVDALRIGVAFAGSSRVGLEGDASLTHADGTVEKSSQYTQTIIPFTLRAGINWEIASDFELGFDVRYWHYQVLQEQRTSLDPALGGQEEFTDPKNYGNSWNWCMGMLYRITPELELMMGYQHDYTPIPDETFSLENPSRTQYGISLGARWQISEDVKLGLAAVRNWFQQVDVQTSVTNPPSNAKGHGAAVELGFDIMWRL